MVEQAVEAVVSSELALTDRAVSLEHRQGVGEFVGAAERVGVRLEFAQQAGDPLPGRLEDAGVGVDEFALNPVSERAPAVLAEAKVVMDREPSPLSFPVG